jgi:hypothetical protein
MDLERMINVRLDFACESLLYYPYKTSALLSEHTQFSRQDGLCGETLQRC